MNAEKLPEKWFERAREDHDIALFIQGMYPVPIGSICYHCEQSCEKMLKGFLAFCGIEAPKTHDLVLLCKMCEKTDSRFGQLAEPCFRLTPHGVNVRYPADEELDETDMRKAISDCEIVFRFVEQIMTQDEPDQEEAPGMAPMSL